MFDSDIFIEVILPLGIPGTYTYQVHQEHVQDLKIGKRVEVQFGKQKIYSGLIAEIHDRKPDYRIKSVILVMDEAPIVNDLQFKLWNWMSTYYMTPLGNVMNAALPAGLKLSSETSLVFNPSALDQWEQLSDNSFVIAEALEKNMELTIGDIQQILNKKSVYKEVQELIDEKVAFLKETLKSRYKARYVRIAELHEDYRQEDKLNQAFEHLLKSPKQQNLLMLIVQKHLNEQLAVVAEVLKQTKLSSSVLKSLEKKGIVRIIQKEVSRLKNFDHLSSELPKLSLAQKNTIKQIKAIWEKQMVGLLHGVTGSGKTEIFIQLIHEQLKKKTQVLYLLPEIALTTQIIQRLRMVFGDQVGVYHSRYNRNEQVEVWNKLLQGDYQIILGPRSAMFLPFDNLGLVVIDEEHDSSYKQFDPSPRYQSRDSAIVLAGLHKAKVILGSATPSIESYYNSQQQKFGLIELNERYGGIPLPKIEVVDIAEELRKKKMKSIFSESLIQNIEFYLNQKEQVILFQNRRGYAPFLLCPKCSHVPQCKNCDVSLTYHQYNNSLKCHVCGLQRGMMHQCVACDHKPMLIKGFGTEKIEDELKIYFPDAIIGRMDYDSIKGKHGYERILDEFGNGLIDILVGTQMVTKGLDFNNVGLAAVLDADQLFHFPEYRATERAFQLLTQVSGRSGRKFRQGKVLIQTSNSRHPVMSWVQNKNYKNFYQTELSHRKKFQFPPFFRLIIIELKHKDKVRLNRASLELYKRLNQWLGELVIGPAEPLLSRIKGKYVKQLLIRFDKNQHQISTSKIRLKNEIEFFKTQEEGKGVFIQINVDP